jgi:FAD:protein FMN transferase
VPALSASSSRSARLFARLAALTTSLVLLATSLVACSRDEPAAARPSQAPAPLAARDAGRPERAAAAPLDAAVDVVPSEHARDAGPSGPALHKAQRKLMGTIWSITIAGGEAAAAGVAAERALDHVAELEAMLSEWRPDSDISRVNQAAGVAPVKVGPELLECVRASLAVARWSRGAFDISWAGLRGLWDFSPDSARIPPTPAEVKARLPLWNYRNIVLDEAKGTVFLRRTGMQIGLGGVAKGYALDRAGELLTRAGFPNFLIYAGGQVLVHGKKGERLWRVGIQHPREPRHFAFVEIEDGSLATSGDYEHAWTHEGRTYHHILDPKTGYPSTRTSSVTLIAETALWADAVDTAIFIMGPAAGLKALESAPGGPFEAAVVDPAMRLHLSSKVRERLVFTAEIEPDGLIGRSIPPAERVRPGP